MGRRDFAGPGDVNTATSGRGLSAFPSRKLKANISILYFRGAADNCSTIRSTQKQCQIPLFRSAKHSCAAEEMLWEALGSCSKGVLALVLADDLPTQELLA